MSKAENSIVKKLSNNLTVVIEPNPTVESVAVGMFCKTGSIDEFDDEAGISHFIEHMLFKGTKTRSSKEIAEAVEGKGGVLNAYTDKEATCYYCLSLKDNLVDDIDLLADMHMNSVFDSESLENEIGVVLEEIKRGEDEPSDFIHELHLEKRWGTHPYGKPIIGTTESVSSFRKEHILKYMDRRYHAGNLILSVAGNINPDDVMDIAEKKLGSIKYLEEESTPIEKPVGTEAINEISKDVEQVHFCIGTDVNSIYDFDDVYTCNVLNSILGAGMSSRLFQEIREHRGLAYAIGSYKIYYKPGGIFNVFGGTSPKNWKLVQELVKEELEKIKIGEASDQELEKAKNSVCGQMVLGTESMNAKMQRNGRQMLFYDKLIPMKTTIEGIRKVTLADIKKFANKIFVKENMNTTAIGPF